MTAPVVAGTFVNGTGGYAPQIQQVYAYANRVVLIWDRPTAPLATINGFQVLAGDDSVLAEVDANLRNVTVTGLTSSTAYTLRVVSKLRSGLVGSTRDDDMVSVAFVTTNSEDPVLDESQGYTLQTKTCVVVVVPPKDTFQHKPVRQAIAFG